MLPRLLKNILLTFFANFRHGELIKKKRVLLALLGLALLPALIIMQTLDMFSVWMQMPTMGAAFLVRFVATSFLAVLVLLFLTSLPSVMHHFFLAQDLSLLKALPIDKRTIFTAKYIQVTLGNVGMYVAVGGPLLVSMGLALGASPAVFFIMLVVSLLFIFIPTGCAAIFTFALARLFSIAKMRRLSTFILGFFIITTWAGLQLVRLSRLNPASSNFEPQAVRSFAAWSLHDWLLPSDWLVNSLHAATMGRWQTIAINLAALSLFSGLLAYIAIVWRIKLEGKDIRLDAGRAGKAPKDVRTRILRPALAMLRKDLQVTRRDNRLLQSSLLLGAMLLVSPFVTSADAGNQQGTVELFMSYIPLTILTLITSSTLARQGLPLERLSLPYMLQAPVTLRSILVTKMMRASLIIAPFTFIACVITSYKNGTALPAAALLIAEHLLFIPCGAITGGAIAVFTTNYDWSDPRYMTNPMSTYLSTFIVLAVGAIGSGIVIGGWLVNQQMVAFLIFFVYVFLVFYIGLRVALARFTKLQWIY